MQELVAAEVITKPEDWDNLSIKQIQHLLDYTKPQLTEEDIEGLLKGFELNEDHKKSIEDRFYGDLVDNYRKDFDESESDEKVDLLSNEIVKRRKTEQELRQIKHSIKTKLNSIVDEFLK